MMFQGTFAIITAAIVCGSFAERMKFSTMVVFIFFWHFLVYCVVAHWEWAPDGFLFAAGALDYAGGDVVHISAGMSGLAASIIIGPRQGFGVKELKPHNVLYTMIGGSMLWVGWFGFNAGSAGGAGGAAGFALLTTQIAAGTSGVTWMLLEWALRGRPSVLGIVSGAVAGLVVITPGCGYVDQTGAFCMGLLGAPICFLGVQLKHRLGYDDALDAFGVHGVGGIAGGILTGFFANDFITNNPNQRGVFYGRPVQLGLQIYGIVVVGGWSFVVSGILLLILGQVMGLRVSEETERVGLDISEHDETVVLALPDPGPKHDWAQHSASLKPAAPAAQPVVAELAPGRAEATNVYLPQQAGPAQLSQDLNGKA
jgi:ammonium transporter, Amt family